MIIHCVNCGQPITQVGPPSANGWHTGWLHSNGYMVCDPGTEDGRRAIPDPQLRLDL